MTSRQIYYSKNRERELALAKRFREENHDLMLTREKSYRERNREKMRIAARARYWRNRDQINERKKLSRRNNPEKARMEWKKYDRAHPGRRNASFHKWWLKRKYKISLEKYASMLAVQSGCCGICGVTLTTGKIGSRRACVDHDHETNVVRGILCGRCNWSHA